RCTACRTPTSPGPQYKDPFRGRVRAWRWSLQSGRRVTFYCIRTSLKQVPADRAKPSRQHRVVTADVAQHDPECLEALAELRAAQEQWEDASALAGRAQAIREEVGAPLPPCDQPNHARVLAAICRALAPGAFP